ncbi:glycosyltransferase family 4 protein [Sediminibacterium sp.]|uniref:glycosyltransferase family 4 protein n=1 Tax=Sediminibacterium sp. TaxID=1917865 RepID=UPI003F6E476C
MNILFLTLANINSIETRGIYEDLIRKFRDEGHKVTVITPVERRRNIATNISIKEGVTILQVKTLNIQKTNIFEKGIGTLAIEYQYLYAIKKELKSTSFDLVLYSTPPISYINIIKFIKKTYNAYSYLLLKDIFPQNAVDMRMMKYGSFLHKFFQRREKQLYDLSDSIGCMSEANRKYILKYNPHINANKVEVNPNSLFPCKIIYDELSRKEIRIKYNLPIDKKILVYGGNLGKPQGLDFLLDTITNCKYSNVFFLIIGNGTEYKMVSNWFNIKMPKNALLLSGLPKNEYDNLLAACDIGLIFLHRDFTIPNFPSRLLSYLEMCKPVISATDKSTDLGKMIEENNCGINVNSGDQIGMQDAIQKLVKADNLVELGENSWRFLNNYFHIDISYNLIIGKIIK